jgi:hypothetical protein
MLSSFATIYNATKSVAHFKNENIFPYFENALACYNAGAVN